VDMARLVCGSFAGVALFAMASAAAPGEVFTTELYSALQSSDPSDELTVIINFGDKVDVEAYQGLAKEHRQRVIVAALKKHAETSQAAVRDHLEAHGGKEFKQLWIRNALAVTASAQVIEELAEWPGIERIGLDRSIKAQDMIHNGSVTPVRPQ
jgi:DNA-binding phage protein